MVVFMTFKIMKITYTEFNRDGIFSCHLYKVKTRHQTPPPPHLTQLTTQHYVSKYYVLANLMIFWSPNQHGYSYFCLGRRDQ
eukprot:CCRYP_018303-RA/>CCRYP_018303-RA protein AED:0.00 eAED:0.00 QI:16/1/1/1/0/0/2/264/81